MRFDWDPAKDAWLREERDISFEEVVSLIESGKVLAVLEHPKRSHQRVLVVEREGYALNVPCVLENGIWFLKTVYPSRVSTKKFLGDEE